MIGKAIAHYQILDKLGEGGMGVVYKALDTHLDRLVALKVLPPDRVADGERRMRFVQEAKAASALNHPNIIHVYDIGSAGGVEFIAMEYVSGNTLERRIGRGGLRLSEALDYAVQIADALAKAHAAGIIHRDLKPSNVMINDDGIVKVLDFGLAKLGERRIEIDEAASTATAETKQGDLTARGVILGTVAYMSPEQASGKPVDARSDIFSFGSVLYEMLTGRRAFQGDSAALTLAAVLREDPKPLTEVVGGIPAELERVLRRCLNKDLLKRWQSMSDLKGMLQDLKEGSDSGKLRAASTSIRPSRDSFRWLAAAALVILTAAGGALWLYLRTPAPPAQLEISRLTLDTGLTTDCAISQDGKLAAYASDRSGEDNLDIYVQQIAGREPIRLTRHPADDRQPSFSPDGSRIVFNSSRDGGGIYIIDALGGQERRIADRGYSPRFSPDGSLILYVELTAVGEAAPGRLSLIPSQGGPPRQFHPDFEVRGNPVTGPAGIWSPDGRHVLFSGHRRGIPATFDWWVAPLDGGAPIQTGAVKNVLSQRRIIGLAYPYSWFGNRLLFAQGVSMEGINLFSARIDSGHWQISGPPQRLTSGAGIQIEPSIAGDGRFLFANLAGRMLVRGLPLDSSRGTPLGEPQQLTSDEAGKIQAHVSGDGSRLAYVAYTSSRLELRLRDLPAGRETIIVPRGDSANLIPRLNRDGSVLAYRDFFDNQWHSFLVSGESAAGRQICDGCVVRSFFSNPEEAVVQFGSELARLSFTKGNRTTIVKLDAGLIRDAALSPDDRWLALVTEGSGGGFSLRLAPVGRTLVPESGWILLDESEKWLGSPAWFSNGSMLYFLSDRDGYTCIWASRLDPSSKKPLGPALGGYHEHRPRFKMGGPRDWISLSASRDQLFFMTAEASGNIYMSRLPPE